MCSIDGLYYKDEKSFVVCSNGYASYQPCPPGTKTDKFPSYTAGYYYGSSDLCTTNLVDYGFSPYSYMPHVVSHDKKPHTSYEVITIFTVRNLYLHHSAKTRRIMLALWNRADHYIFILSFVYSFFFFFFPRIISAVAEWMSAILAHMVWP